MESCGKHAWYKWPYIYVYRNWFQEKIEGFIIDRFVNHYNR